MTIRITDSTRLMRRPLADILAPLETPKNVHNMPSRAANHHSSQLRGGDLEMYSRAGISRQVAAPTKTETNLAVRSQADMDVVVAAEAEVTMVDTSTWNQCS